MADRLFDNVMPDSVEEKEIEAGGNSLLNLLAMPYSSFSQHLKRSALDLKETLLEDFTLYSGTLGAAFLHFRAYQVTGNSNDLSLLLQIVKSCDIVSASSGGVTFLCGRAGVCRLGAVAAKVSGKEDLLSYYLAQFRQVSYLAIFLTSYCIEDLVIYGLVCISTNTLAKKLSLQLPFFPGDHQGRKINGLLTVEAHRLCSNCMAKGTGCSIWASWHHACFDGCSAQARRGRGCEGNP